MFHDWVSREVFGLKLSVSVAAQYNRVADIRLTNCGMFLERAGEHVKGDWSDGGPVVLKLGGSLLDLWDLGERLLEFRDRKSTRLNSSHIPLSRMPSSA